MESEFDIDKLIEIANKYYPKFYKEFISIFNNNKEVMITIIKLSIDIENEKYRYEFVTYKFDYYTIIRDVALFYEIFKNEKEFYENFMICE